MPTNFRLAPEPKQLLGNMLAVPIDIQSVEAEILLDWASQAAMGKGSVQFIAGQVDGHPVFDLRQTITDLRLDGTSIGAAAAPMHDLGGGSEAEMRVLAVPIGAGTNHTMDIEYAVGLPQAPGGGSYPPALQYLAGGEVRLSFGFTDLVPARYLEAWVPSNLIFDQFRLRLDLRIIGTNTPHTVITNGTLSDLGTNHFLVEWPERITALSPLIELHPASRLEKAVAVATLPNGDVTVEAWKRSGGPADLAGELARLTGWLEENATEIGPYIHGDRFVAYLQAGAMEYDGGTTSIPGPLRHETHHSWWGRGVKPAGQPDGWIDEAWTSYFDEGGDGSSPFDFSDAPVVLCNRNRWSRKTPTASYDAGSRFFAGLASIMGTNGLKTAMSAFYVENRTKPVTTSQLEEHLVTRSPRDEIIDGFHRFVYGHGDQASTPDLWLKDDPADQGQEPWTGRFWDSPDLWVRNADDGGLAHQSPEAGQANWFYARVRNRGAGIARHFVVTFAAANYVGMEFTYPADWAPVAGVATAFDLGPGEQRLVKARWPRHLVPAPGNHTCLLASVRTMGDHPAAGNRTWEHNGLAQKNLTIVDVKPDEWFTLPLVISRLARRVPGLLLELRRRTGEPSIEARLIHSGIAGLPKHQGINIPDRRAPIAVPSMQPPNSMDALGLPVEPRRRFSTPFSPSESAALHLPSIGAQRAVELALRAPNRIDQTATLDLVLREHRGRNRVVGGLAVEIRTKAGHR